MKKTAIESIIKQMSSCLLLLGAAVAMSGCSNMIYDHDDDCDPHYKIRFRYDYNLKKTDAFAQEVNAVTLYVVDPSNGNIVWKRTDSSDAVKREGYTMELDGLKPGSYQLLAWAGDGHNDSPHFTMGTGDNHTDLTARINHDGTGIVTNDLDRLYKDLDFEYKPREFSPEWGEHVDTVRLMKNTNDITVILQQLSGEAVDPKAFTYEIEEANAFMDHTNRLTDNETSLTYKPYSVRAGLAAGYVPENLQEAQFSCAIADFTVGRMMSDRKMWLTIRKVADNEIVARVPVIDYSLLVKGHYGSMPDQEYLDRQDQYSMVFFLDEGLRWVDTYVYINSWHVVLGNYDL